MPGWTTISALAADRCWCRRGSTTAAGRERSATRRFPEFDAAKEAIETRAALTADLPYRDHEGAQGVISRFGFWPRDDDAPDRR